MYYIVGRDLPDETRVAAELDNEGRSLAQVLVEQAKDLGIVPADGLARVVEHPRKDTEISAVDIVLSFCIEAEGVAEGLDKGTLETTLFKPEVWSACFNTADRLFRLLGVSSAFWPGQSLSQLAQPPPAYASRRFPDLPAISAEGDEEEALIDRREPMRSAMKALCDDMAAALGQNRSRIYNCGFGIHGFCFVARNGRVEMLQSFANGLKYQLPGITIAESLKLNKSFAIDEIRARLLEFGSDDAEVRRRAQEALFETGIETPERPFPRCQLYWEADDLLALDMLIGTIRERLRTNIALLKRHQGKVGRRTKRVKEAQDLVDHAT